MAAANVNWSRIYQSLGLGKNSTATLQAFRKRAEDARRQLQTLKHERTDVDVAHYKSILKNQDVVNQAEKILKDFKPVTYDVSAQLKAIDAFEAKATEQAQASADKIEAELKDLKATLKNIEDARPFDQLTVDDVVAARPEIRETVEAMMKQGKFSTPQYTEKFGSESTLLTPTIPPKQYSLDHFFDRPGRHLIGLRGEGVEAVMRNINYVQANRTESLLHRRERGLGLEERGGGRDSPALDMA
ncbi:hypothetical protein FA10DRAFT_229223 [Acaromyces ingoldii]|uniref:ATP synthase subunit d, mitochondrial n=1 Tax=Acaromyces ingoldii TaxID=215250 RepID=A0A316YPK4_9BASI|nr:hypothetical protein FA10DRAFT_229223 [Acaromyces ingoldii]PWN90734.1 hypothetical protein FA10DRAFT_229223 [Acaromyces ingoldii]